jgi:hypothetical protein
MKKKEPNRQTKSVYWLVTKAIHELRGVSPYGDHRGTLSLRRGQNRYKKRYFKAKNAK